MVRKLAQTFESDWTSRDVKTKAEPSKQLQAVPELDTKQVEKVLVQELHPITATVKKAVGKLVERAGEEALENEIVKSTVKRVVKRAVKQAVKTVAANNGKA
jgi:uncharacterized phage protein gp47/JayE